MTSSSPQPTEALLDDHFADTERFGTALACYVTRDNELVTQRYGINPHSGDAVTASTTLISWSMAKSMLHAIVGMLVLDGELDVNAPAPVAEWANDGRSEITLHHLLTMTSGLEFNEDYVGDDSHCIQMLFGDGQADMGHYAASFDLLHRPGSVFNYSSGTSNIVSRICRNVLGGQDAYESYIRTRLFEPLGLNSASAKFDDAGTFIGSSFVYASAADYARFGQLYLQDGVWDNQQLLPSGWVEAARSPIPVEVPDDNHYGAHWWLWDEPKGFGAHGFEGQYTLVVPSQNLVVVRLGVSPTDDQKTNTRHWLTELCRSL